MKKLIKILGIVLVIIIAAMIILPFVFKDQITEAVKNATNNSMNAKVDFESVDLSLFSSFPYLDVNVNKFSIVNNKPFEGDTLFSAKTLNASLDVISVIKGDVIKIKSVSCDFPKVLVYVRKDKTSNYKIAKESTEQAESKLKSDTTKSNFNIDLQSYTITNGQIAYVDQSTGILVAVNNLNHEGRGDFSQDNFILETKTTVDELTVEMEGVKYLNKVKSSLDMQLAINLPNFTFTLKDNRLAINNLQLKFDGTVAMPKDNIDLDLSFNSPRSDFKDIISLIPAIYKNNFSELKSSGKMEVAGKLKGTMGENKLPSFNVDLKIADGNFKYPNLPTPVNNVNVNLNISNKDGVIDHTVVNLSKIHLELGNEPIDGKLLLSNPQTGPNVETEIKGKIDLANIKKTLDLKNILELEGIITSDFEAKGNIASSSKNYENINAKGNISVSNIVYKGTESDQKVTVSTASLNFTPKNIQLNNFAAKIGENDIKADGALNNLISFVLSDGILVGNLNVSSNYFDFNPYLTSSETASEAQKTTEAKKTAFDIPQNINFTMRGDFKKLLYDNLELTNITGQIIVKESKVSLENLKMNLLQGSLSGNGFYTKTKYQENPDIQFNLDINNFNVKQTFEKFVTVKQFAPMAKYIEGSFSSKLSLKTSLDNTLTPVWDTFFSNGLLNLKSAEIKNFKPFTTVGSLLNLQELSNPKLENVNPKFEIKNGRFFLSPMSYKIGNYNVVLSGSNGIDQSLDYVMEIDVPAGKVKDQANKAIANLLKKDVNLITANSVKVKALIGGTIESPNVKTSAGNVVSDVASGVVEQVKEKIVDEAKAKIDSVKIKAEQKLKEEAKKKEEEAKKKLEEEAKKKLKKLFKFG